MGRQVRAGEEKRERKETTAKRPPANVTMQAGRCVDAARALLRLTVNRSHLIGCTKATAQKSTHFVNLQEKLIDRSLAIYLYILLVFWKRIASLV